MGESIALFDGESLSGWGITGNPESWEVEEGCIHCKGLKDLRTRYRAQLNHSCSCDRRLGSGGELSCGEFFDGLGDASKAMFMLGGPTGGRTLEARTDACAADYVRRAYKRRSDVLSGLAECPLFVDLTAGHPVSNRTHSHIPSTARAQHATLAQSTIGVYFGSRANGSGLNGTFAKSRE